jgi:hypothetical protein
MLEAALLALAIAVLVGTLLAVLHLRSDQIRKVPWPLAALHALFALGGFAALLATLGGPPRGVDQGTSSFGAISGWMLVLAVLFGLLILAARLRGRARAGGLIGIHATLAVSGFVLFAVYVLS